jgi:tetratricopeptide (TPR) repeat protein
MMTANYQAPRRRKPVLRVPALCILLLSVTAALPAQTRGAPGDIAPDREDLNSRYRFPLSLGVEYQSLSPFAGYGVSFNIFDISATLRRPLPALPVLQPALRVGMLRFDSLDPVEPLRWDHTHWYGQLGLVLAHRFTKNFEVGAELFAGASEAVFPDLSSEGPLGTQNLLVETGARIALNPSYNFNIEVHPSLKYLRSFSPLSDFDGLSFGLGFSASFRLGVDPDLASNVIRALRLSEAELPPLFAAMQSYYARNPAGTITITNTEKQPLRDVQISFFQPGYMDSPTAAAAIPELAPGESREVELFAVFNQEIFKTEGVTPLTGEVITAYRVRGREVEQRQSLSYELHDKTALTWDDDRKAAAFVTPADSALRNYASFIRQAAKDQVIPTFNENLQYAVQAYNALAEIGMLYQQDPVSPFTRVQGDPRAVDSINLPRDTLGRTTGDCDDLTALYCSLLEAAGIETGYITVPGHIYAVFNTKEQAGSYRRLHPDREMTFNVNGELWVPVEITLIGKSAFPEAWRRGMEEWREVESRPEQRVFVVTRQAQELYRPVGLREADLGLQYGSGERIAAAFNRDMDRLADTVLADFVAASRQRGGKEDFNRLGVAYARFRRFEPALNALRQALKIDANYLAAQVNLGNVYFLQENYREAAARYQATYDRLQGGGADTALAQKLLLNLSAAQQQLGNYGEAEKLLALARSADPRGGEALYAARTAESGGARAAGQASAAAGILFAEEE